MKRTLKGIRCDLGLTQEEMAKRLDISVVTYRNKEMYKSRLTASELITLAKMVGIKAEDIKI